MERVPSSVVIPAVDHLGLLRMQLQPARREPLRQHTLEPSGLRLAYTVAEDVIGEAFERNVWMVLCHPPIKRVVQEEIREQW